MIQVWRLIQTSNLISRTQSIFTMFTGRKCLQVKINLTNLYIMFGTWEARRLKRSPQSKFSCGPLDINSWVDPSWDATLNEPVPRLIRMLVCDWAQKYISRIYRAAFVIFSYEGVFPANSIVRRPDLSSSCRRAFFEKSFQFFCEN